MQNYHKISLFANDTNAPVKVELHENGQYFVSARDLYTFLGIQTDFTDWCKRMFEYGFKKDKDYSRLKIGERQAHNKIDYVLSISCAKEIAMVQRNEKGKEVRQYFLDCETRLHQVQALIQESREQEVASLREETKSLERRFDNAMQNIDANFKQIAIYCQKLDKYLDNVEERLEALEANQHQDKGTLHTTVERVDKIEERLDFKAEACVYVMYCPRKQWYKLGSSHDAKGRKKDFNTIELHLIIKFDIPTVSREAAYSLENMLKKHFANKHKEGEWYGLIEDDLSYLQTLQQSNLSYLLKMS